MQCGGSGGDSCLLGCLRGAIDLLNTGNGRIDQQVKSLLLPYFTRASLYSTDPNDPASKIL